MTQIRVFLLYLIFILLGLLAWATWMYEVMYILGWPGLKWLNISVAPYAGCGLQAIALAIAASCSIHKVSLIRLFGVVVALAAVGGASYYVASNSLLMFCGRFGCAIPINLAGGGLAMLIAATGWYWIIGCILEAPLSFRNSLYLSFSLPLSLALGLLTLIIFPYRESDLLNGIKMGYPAFWAVVLPGALLLNMLHGKERLVLTGIFVGCMASVLLLSIFS